LRRTKALSRAAADHHKKDLREEDKALFTKVSSNKLWHLNLNFNNPPIKEE
jgi:hypothetical protein